MASHRVSRSNAGLVMLRCGAGLMVAALLGACTSPWVDSPKSSVEPSLSMENEGIAFVVIPYRKPSKSYNRENKSMYSCEEKSCGSPISVFYDNGVVQHVPSVGGRGDLVAISPNRQYLVISDAYGIHFIHENTKQTYKKSEITDAVRGIYVNDAGDFFSIEHVGSREVDGTVQFSSLVGWKYHDQYQEKLVGLDGMLVNCNNDPLIYSYGDEDDKKTHIYTFDFEQAQFKESYQLQGFHRATPALFSCDENERGIIHGTIDPTDNPLDSESAYYFIKNGTIEFQSSPAFYNERGIGSNQPMSAYKNIIYHIKEPGYIHRYNIEDNKFLEDISLYNLIPETNDRDKTNVSLVDDKIFSVSKGQTGNKWIVSEVDMQGNGSLVRSAGNKYLDKYYKKDKINFLYIFNPDPFRAWADREGY